MYSDICGVSRLRRHSEVSKLKKEMCDQRNSKPHRSLRKECCVSAFALVLGCDYTFATAQFATVNDRSCDPFDLLRCTPGVTASVAPGPCFKSRAAFFGATRLEPLMKRGPLHHPRPQRSGQRHQDPFSDHFHGDVAPVDGVACVPQLSEECNRSGDQHATSEEQPRSSRRC